MLTHIHVRNLAIVDEVDVELDGGMTALTGETGAGKSILVDALGLVLGGRADSNVVRHGSDRAEISAGFDIDNNPAVMAWLQQRDLDMDGECQVRRIISRKGRSRGYINTQSVPLQSLHELGEQLVDIHGQHEHQSLLRTPVQRQLLDSYGGHLSVLDKVSDTYADWRTASDTLNAVVCDETDRSARVDLLRFQLQELENLGLSVTEIESIDEEHSRQANAGRLLEASQQGLQRLDAEDSVSASSLINQTLDELNELATLDSGLEDAGRLLNDAAIHIQETIERLRQYIDALEIDPARLDWLEQRIGVLHDLARKHRCKPEQLPDIEEKLRAELNQLEHADEHRAGLEARVTELEQAYIKAAKKLTAKRKQAARAFSKEITEAMQTLGMAGGVFDIGISPRSDAGFGVHGIDAIEFRVSANKGQPVQPLGKVASGGELSRISLSIQVISAGEDTIPTLIFDEVDSGIGGGVAEIVGRKLRALAIERQILCVTHLPQVAALAHQQLQVSKLAGKETSHTRVNKLDEKGRVDELARMLGGVKITAQTRKHAREMMKNSGNDSKQPGKRRTTTLRE